MNDLKLMGQIVILKELSHETTLDSGVIVPVDADPTRTKGYVVSASDKTGINKGDQVIFNKDLVKQNYRECFQGEDVWYMPAKYITAVIK